MAKVDEELEDVKSMNEALAAVAGEEPPRTPTTVGVDPFRSGPLNFVLTGGKEVYRFMKRYSSTLQLSGDLKPIRANEGDSAVFSEEEAEAINRDSPGTLEMQSGSKESRAKFNEALVGSALDPTAESLLPTRGTVLDVLMDQGEGGPEVVARTSDEGKIAEAAKEAAPEATETATTTPEPVKRQQTENQNRQQTTGQNRSR